MTWRNWLCALIGIWFIVAPWVLGVSDQIYATRASIIAGAIQVFVSIWAAFKVDIPSWKTWENWVTGACGLWFVLQPFLGEYESTEYYATVGPGLLTMALSLWTLMADPRSARNRPANKLRT